MKINKFSYDQQYAQRIQAVLEMSGLLEPTWCIRLPGQESNPYGPIMQEVVDGQIVYTAAGSDGYWQDLFSAVMSMDAVRAFIQSDAILGRDEYLSAVDRYTALLVKEETGGLDIGEQAEKMELQVGINGYLFNILRCLDDTN